jgi:hypothetical protein
MPRRSDRKLAIQWMKSHVRSLRKDAVIREVLQDDDSIEDDYLMLQEHKLKQMENSRYLFREKTYRKRTKFDLDDCILQSGSQNFTDREFLHSFHMTRQSFHLLVEEMRTKKAFRQSRFKKQ